MRHHQALESMCYVIFVYGSRSGVGHRSDTEPAHLRDVGQADDVGHQADDGDEDLPAFPEGPRELVHQRRDEALHRAELRTRWNTVLRAARCVQNVVCPIVFSVFLKKIQLY